MKYGVLISILSRMMSHKQKTFENLNASAVETTVKELFFSYRIIIIFLAHTYTGNLFLHYMQIFEK